MDIDQSVTRICSLLLIFSLALTPHIFLLLFYGSLFTPLSQLFLILSRSYLKTSEFLSAPRLISRCKTPPTWTLLAPTACQPPPLVPAPHDACLRLLMFPCWISPPFADLGLNPGPCRPLGGLPVAGPSVSDTHVY